MRKARSTTLALLLLGAAVHAESGEPPWTLVTSPNFTVISDAKEADARRAAWQFEQIRALFAQQWPWARLSSGRPFLILAARNEASLKELLPGFWEAKGQARPAGVFLAGPDRSYAALRVDTESSEEGSYFNNPYHVLHHEYVHLLVNLNFQEMPMWLNEGLAEYWGDTVVSSGQLSKGKPIAGHVMLLRERPLLPVETLFRVGPGSPHYTEENKASIFYAQSWALVHYLFFAAEGEARQSLDRMAGALKRGVPVEQATADSLPDPAMLDKALQAYVRRPAFHFQKVPAPLLPEAMKTYHAEPLSPARSCALRGTFLANSGRLREARDLVDRALELDPSLAESHEAAGVLALRDKRLADAQASFTRAAEIDPENFLTQYMKARFLVTGGGRGEENLEAAENAAAASVKLNVEFAPAYALLAMVSAIRGAPLDKTRPLALRAVALAPGSPEGHLSLAAVLAQAGQADEARAAAERAVACGRTESERALIRNQLEAMGALGRRRGRPAAEETPK